ncbi:TIM barrel protein [Arthrobacter sp. Sa2BUA2]|uniref:TIM barrel protein n=1 Tax=Arthrobacter pullicola TaxID=2762224 RepID=A0ABR8YF57_9MICC|nr:TIM barrel protein [Arthrobacter pullicola]MBD8042843.1 TIM barrel protein [Arthrobacter pullicola]
MPGCPGVPGVPAVPAGSGWSVNCSILLTDLPLLERPAAAAAAGFGAVEFWWPFDSAVPDDLAVGAFLRAVSDAGVQLTGLNFYAGNMAAGERGVVSSPSRIKEFRASLDTAVGIARLTGCTGFNALYGIRETGISEAEQDATAAENLMVAADAVAHLGGTVLVEPLSGVPGYPLRTAADCFAVIDRVRSGGMPNIALLADFYHLAVNGEDVPALIAGHAGGFGHIQIADAPGRGSPGTGGLPIARWILAARAAGYTGPISLEYQSPSAEAFNWLQLPASDWADLKEHIA